MRRWWGIRHVRYAMAVWAIAQVREMRGESRIGPMAFDLAYLNAIWRGER